MKKLILLFLSVLMMMPMIEVKGQTSLLRDTTIITTDTVYNRHRYYYYPEWWDTVGNYCNDDYLSKITPITSISQGSDSRIRMLAKQIYVNRPISIKGMAVMVDRHPEKYVQGWRSNVQLPEYVWMANYHVRADTMEAFAITRWDTAAPKTMVLQYACDSAHGDPSYMPNGIYDTCYVYEAYFEHPVMVDSIFWAVGTKYNNETEYNEELCRFEHLYRPICYQGAVQQERPWQLVGGPIYGQVMVGKNNTGWMPTFREWGRFLPIVRYQYLLEVDVFEDYGRVEGGGWYEDSSLVEVTAIPNPGLTLSHWSDGCTDNPRMLRLTSDTSIVAYFMDDPLTKQVSAISDNLDMGVVTGGGYYPDSTIVELQAVPGERYLFTHWSDGDTNNPKYYKVASDTTFRAYFVKNPNYVKKFRMTVNSNDSHKGVVSGNGMYDSNSVARIMASPITGCEFDAWSDGDTTNPRDILMNRDTVMTAYFIGTPVGIAEVETEKVTMLPNPSDAVVNITAESVMNNLECYDLSGKLIWQEAPKSNRALLNVSQWTPGIYVVKITTERGVSVKKLVVQ